MSFCCANTRYLLRAPTIFTDNQSSGQGIDDGTLGLHLYLGLTSVHHDEDMYLLQFAEPILASP
jgi:hypothetical protein